MAELRLEKDFTPLTATVDGKKVTRKFQKYASDLTEKELTDAGYSRQDLITLATRMLNTDRRNGLAVKMQGKTVKQTVNLKDITEIS